MNKNKTSFLFILLAAIFLFSSPNYILALESRTVSVSPEDLSLSFSETGDILEISAGGKTFPSRKAKTFKIKNMGNGAPSIFADSDNSLFFIKDRWNKELSKNTGSSIINRIKTDGKKLGSALTETANAEKINIDISAMARGKINSFITISATEYDSSKNKLNNEKPVAFRFNTKESGTNNLINKRFTFVPSPLCKFISLSLIPSQGINVFSCKKLSIYKVGDRLFNAVDLEMSSADKDKTEFSGKNGNFGLTVSFEPKGKYIICSGNLKSLNNRESAAIVRFSLPLSSDTLFWHDTLSDKRMIKGDETFSKWHKLGKERFFSVYPFSLITSGNSGIVYAVPPQFPRIFRTGYSKEDGYFIEFDLGLSAETKKFPSSASFTFIIYGQNSEWGLRESAKKFYGFFPQYFKKTNKKEGIWFAWLDPKKIYIPQDFGFMFDTTFNKSYYLDRYYGINYFYYQEPYGIGIQWKKNKLPNRIPENVPYEEILKKIHSKSFAEGKTFKTSVGRENFAIAAIDSAMKNEDGKYYIGYYRPYLYTNPDPELPYGQLVTERVSYRQKNAEADGNSIAGQFIDSVVPARWAIKENYDKEHFSYADIPLSFSYETGKPVELGVFQSYELFSAISKITRNNGGLTLANTWYPMQSFYYGFIDIIGAGEYSSDQPIDNFHYLRSIASKKTLSFIDNELIEGNLSKKEIEKRFMKCLAFAVYPGAFPFREPSKYEGLRPFYKKYIPLINLISSAGWEPVTFASASHPSLNVERFGSSDRNLYFTIYNPTKRNISFTLDIHSKVLGKLNNKKIFYYNLISGSTGQFGTLKENHLTHLVIGPEDTILLQTGTKENIIAGRLLLAGQFSQSLGNFFIESSQKNNLLKNISKQKNIEFEYDGSTPSISGVKIENAKIGETSVFRLSAKPETRKTDFRIDAEYFTEDKEQDKEGYISKIYCLLYSMARFLSHRQLPDITAEVLITDDEGKLIKGKGLQREELTESSKATVFSRKFYVPPESKSLNIVFMVQGNFHSLHLKNVIIYPAGRAYAVYRESELIEKLNSKIKNFYTDNASQEVFNKISEEIISGRKTNEDIGFLLGNISLKAEEHLQAVKKLNGMLTARNRMTLEYILRLNNFIKRIHSIKNFIPLSQKRSSTNRKELT